MGMTMTMLNTRLIPTLKRIRDNGLHFGTANNERITIILQILSQNDPNGNDRFVILHLFYESF